MEYLLLKKGEMLGVEYQAPSTHHLSAYRLTTMLCEVTMEIRYEHNTGWPSQIGLQKRISAYARTDRASAFKIGITNNPEKRASQYRSNGCKYHEMIVLYQTTSDKHVREMERIFCDYYAGNADNLIGGGGGSKGQGPYYLYVVIARLEY